MRWLLTIPFLLIASPAFAQENEAEKLFRAMEKKILDAKSLSILFKVEGHGLDKSVDPPDSITGSGSALFSPGNKVRVEFTTDGNGQKYSPSVVSDGKQFSVRINLPSIRETRPTPANLADALVAKSVTHGVWMLPIFFLFGIDRAELNVDEKVPLTDFKFGLAEKDQLPNSRLIEFKISDDPVKIKIVKLWIDTTTLLPLKRQWVFTAAGGRTEGYLTETYTEFILNPKLDPKLFELPK